MARRFLSPQEVLRRVLDKHDGEVDDLDEINNLESTSKSDEDEFSPSTAIVDEAGIDNDVVCEEGSSELQDNPNESFEQAHKKRKVLPRGRLVKDIESSLDENNYDEYEVRRLKKSFLPIWSGQKTETIQVRPFSGPTSPQAREDAKIIQMLSVAQLESEANQGQ